jgi:predicted metalloprotease with PDZ domain
METKYQIGDTAYVCNDSHAIKLGKINNLHFDVNRKTKEFEVKYQFDMGSYKYPESEIYSSFEEALAGLEKEFPL